MIRLLVVATATFCVAHGLRDFVPPEKENQTLQVITENGWVQGVELEIKDGLPLFAYKGIPYAEPPVDELRFAAPEPQKNWNGILNASRHGPKCMQGVLCSSETSEDCLFLNVYKAVTKSASSPKLLPVMVWMHGGGFVSGSGDSEEFGPDYLIKHDIILVTFNYRLGIFGFLTTGDMILPGNWGLKDQIQALRWVKANIEHFGGNPKDVTIFGESAGGASVSYMLLARKAEGLFHKAISQSGSALCSWAQQQRSVGDAQILYALAKVVGMEAKSKNTVVGGLRKLDKCLVLSVSSSILLLNIINPMNGLPYSPTIEPEHEDAVISAPVQSQLEKGMFNHVPYMAGYTSEESALVQEMFLLIRPILVAADVPFVLIPSNMNATNTFSKIKLSYAIKTRYFNIIGASFGSEAKALKYLSSVLFTKPITETIIQTSKYVPVHFFKFSYEGVLGKTGSDQLRLKAKKNEKGRGVAHTEDTFYLFNRYNITPQHDHDRKMIDKLTLLWTNFAKFGDPTPTDDEILNNVRWEKATPENNFEYLEIDNEFSKHQGLDDDFKFWKNLYDTYGNPPYNTY